MISVIIPTVLENEKILNKCVASFMNSTKEKYEIVVEPNDWEGFEKPVNRAIKRSTGDVVFITNDDVFAVGDWALCIKKIFEDNPEVYIINGTGVFQNGDLFPFWAVAIRKEVFDKVGYLDEEYDTFSSDHDFIMKCKEAGLGILSFKLPLVHLFCHTTKRIKGEEEKMKLARERFKQKWNRE